MTVRLLYFASLGDRMGRREEEIELAGPVTLSELWQSLQDRNPALAGAPRPGFARNATWAAGGELVRDGDEIAFLPAVSGG
jgi:molybdopterin synthase sulfur carrier subunit